MNPISPAPLHQPAALQAHPLGQQEELGPECWELPSLSSWLEQALFHLLRHHHHHPLLLHCASLRLNNPGDYQSTGAALAIHGGFTLCFIIISHDNPFPSFLHFWKSVQASRSPMCSISTFTPCTSCPEASQSAACSTWSAHLPHSPTDFPQAQSFPHGLVSCRARETGKPAGRDA